MICLLLFHRAMVISLIFDVFLKIFLNWISYYSVLDVIVPNRTMWKWIRWIDRGPYVCAHRVYRLYSIFDLHNCYIALLCINTAYDIRHFSSVSHLILNTMTIAHQRHRLVAALCCSRYWHLITCIHFQLNIFPRNQFMRRDIFQRISPLRGI